MSTDQVIEIVRAYERAFGIQHTEALLALNWLADPRFTAAMVEAVATGQRLSVERATERFGPPFGEGVTD